MQACKCNELIGYSKKPIKVISLEMQEETYNPAGQLKHITDFTKRFVGRKYWSKTTRLTNFTIFLKDIVEDGIYTCQDAKLLNFNVSNESIKKLFSDIINDLTVKCNKTFENLQSNLVLNAINILDCRQWLIGAHLLGFGRKSIILRSG